MEPVTHMLTGAVLARTGFHRRAAYATLAMLIAAEFPDVDTLSSLGGPLTSFEHHRGITHTFVAIPFEAALITGAFFLIHRLSANRSNTNPLKKTQKAPANWLLLYAGTLLALLSHILLDWTNNYGIRPFFPFNPRWYAGSFVFIFEPVLFLILVLALVLPALFGLINAEVGARKPDFRSPGWSWTALLLIAALYVFRFDEHAKALVLARQNTPDALSVFASPHPGDPFLWSAVTDTGDALHLSTLHTRTGETDPSHPSDTLYKPPASLALLAAKRSPLGRIYLDWSMYPVLAETPDATDPHHPLTLVTFADARFLYTTFLLRDQTHAPLSGSVLLDMQAPEGQRIVETTFDGKKQN